MIDPSFFNVAPGSAPVAEGDDEIQWCKCGHVWDVHYAIPDFVSNDGQTVHHEPLQCHAGACKCWRFIRDRRLWSRILRKLRIK